MIFFHSPVSHPRPPLKNWPTSGTRSLMRLMKPTAFNLRGKTKRNNCLKNVSYPPVLASGEEKPSIFSFLGNRCSESRNPLVSLLPTQYVSGLLLQLCNILVLSLKSQMLQCPSWWWVPLVPMSICISIFSKQPYKRTRKPRPPVSTTRTTIAYQFIE